MTNIETEQINSGESFGTIRENINNNFANIVTAINTVENEIGSNIEFGVYTGNGAESQTINLGYTPVAVIVYSSKGGQVYYDGYYRYYGGMALNGHPCQIGINGKTVLEITTNGFTVYYNDTNHIFANNSNAKYYFVACKTGTVREVS